MPTENNLTRGNSQEAGGCINNQKATELKIAYEWLDGQAKTVHHLTKELDLAYLVSRWSGLNISRDDLVAAVKMHPEIRGKYPYYTIDPLLTLPSTERLVGICNVTMPRIEINKIPIIYRFYETVRYTAQKEGTLLKTYMIEEFPQPLDGLEDFCLTHDCECYYCVYGR